MILQDLPIGRHIRDLRLQHNMSQSTLVGKMQLAGSSITRSTLANIETGRRNIKATDLRAVKEFFKVDYDRFFAEYPK